MSKSRFRPKTPHHDLFYHVIDRIVGGEFLLADTDKEQFCRMCRRVAKFCGLEFVTFGALTNHVHQLVKVPVRLPLSDQVIYQRCRDYYGPKALLVRILEQSMQQTSSLPPNWRARLTARMGDISVFEKELKQKFSRWYNRVHDRFGTLWADRFKCVAIEPVPWLVRLVAMYIDLNSVRAGICLDPKDYRFCGYGMAVRGDVQAQNDLLRCLPHANWEEAGAAYRQQMMVKGAVSGSAEKAVIDRAAVAKAVARGGKLEPGQVLQLRLRHLSEGLALGSKAFVEEIFVQYRKHFGPHRKNGARRVRWSPFEGLCSLRDLKIDVCS